MPLRTSSPTASPIIPNRGRSSPLASSQAVLTDDERELGVVVVDIGAGTTDFVLYRDGVGRSCEVGRAVMLRENCDIAAVMATATAIARL